MYYVLERTQKLLEALRALAQVQSVPLTEWEQKEGFYLTPSDADAASAPYTPFDSASMQWGGFDRHAWFRLTVEIPQSFAGRPLWLTVETELSGWDATNPQFLAFVDGEPVQGLDTNHREIRLSEQAQGGRRLRLDLQAYGGRFEGARKLSAALVEADPAVIRLYWDLCVPMCIAARLPKDDHRRLKLESILTETLNLIDLREGRTPSFSASVDAAEAYIQKALYTDWAGQDDVIATCIGHTHIDVAWQWTVAQTREKAARSFATVLELMDEYPDYKFMSSQPQLYEFVKERYPELYERIRARIAEGRWEPEGGMWLEADCNLTSGESLVRQLLYGKRFFREEFGADNKIVWLPDVFGYSAALPQIMKKAGIEYFMTTKIAWNQFNLLPCDTFYWRGIDGSEIFTHLITTTEPGQSRERFFTTYNGNLHPDAVMGAWDRYQQKELNNDVLISYGYGDGGGGPTREMIESGVRLAKGLPGAPKVRMEFSRTYFDELRSRVGENPRLPRWDGELYLEYHRGTYTSMARNKRDNRLCELRYRDAELLSVAAGLVGSAYPKEELRGAWKTILLNQFHDILPGSSIHDVYEVTREEYAELLARAGRIIDEKLDALAAACAADGESLLLCNTLSFPRTDVALVDGDVAGQKTHDGKTAVLVRDVPALGCAVRPMAEFAAPGGLRAGGDTVENDFYTVRLGKYGRLESLFDKRASRETLSGEGNVLRVYEDRPMSFDNWDIDIYHKEKYWDIEPESGGWLETGPVRAVYESKAAFLHSAIRQRIIFYAHTARIDFETWVDWQQSQLVMKTLFPVRVNANMATFDIQFGNVQRPTHFNTSWDVARFETCGHKWADLSEDGFGVSLLNNCKYGYDIHEGVMGLTLIKSGIEPNPVTDREEHVFTYALYPHTGGWREGGSAEEAEMLNAPLYSRILHAQPGVAPRPLFTPSADNVCIDAVKLAEDGGDVILRLHEFKNRRCAVTISCGARVTGAYECDLLEEKTGEVDCDGTSLSFVMEPYEIKTFRMKLSK